MRLVTATRMKRWKKISLILFAIVLLAQVPFIYRRFHLRRLRQSINQLSQQRQPAQSDSPYRDYRGVIHVHSSLGGHSTGTFEEIVSAAKQNGLDFVVMTEHPSSAMDTAAMTLHGEHDGVLFISGQEINSENHDRLLIVSDRSQEGRSTATTSPIPDSAPKSLSFVAYPLENPAGDLTRYNGVEVYNLFTNSKKIRPVLMFFDGVWSYGSYPDLLFARFFERPNEALAMWDNAITQSNQKQVAIAGNDAHSNIGFNVGDASGHKYFSIQLDPYVRSFQTVRMHVLIPYDKLLTEDSLLTALRDGHCFISFDIFSDAGGFGFSADNKVDKKMMGDEIALESGIRLNVTAPLKCRFVLFRDGKAVEAERDQSSTAFVVTQPGVYRIEAYLDQLPSTPREKLWIISNPIYVRAN
jgi:cell division protein FtsL